MARCVKKDLTQVRALLRAMMVARTSLLEYQSRVVEGGLALLLAVIVGIVKEGVNAKQA